jgi:hypothetical protein
MAINSGELEADQDKANLLKRLIERGYPFGTTVNGDSFFWDLTSYSEADQSYDIYWIPDEEITCVTHVGRDFFEFISEVCLGPRLSELLPESYASIASELRSRSFTAFEAGGPEGDDADARFDQFLIMNASDWDRWVSFGLTEKTGVKLNGSYHAPSKDQAALLKQAWEKEFECEVRIISGGQSRQISCLVEVEIAKRTITRDFFNQVLEKMVAIGKEYGCLPTSFGAEFNPKSKDVP